MTDLAVIPAWSTPDEAAATLHLHPDTVRRMCRQGDLPGARKFAGSWRVPRGALEPPAEEPRPLIAPPNRRSLAQQGRRSA